ncbi:hypothetical protein [Natrinema caseinilyticum]|uniref:hypothetical protein n=1 Tax=Natrinema caseinilyticum TaxID=2961570 RepID=UPI0020C4F348|nr:hypothetical protein [Natrinema caseinilyticum]
MSRLGRTVRIRLVGRAVFDRVPKQVLEQPRRPVGVGENRYVGSIPQRGVAGLDIRPGSPGEILDRNRLRIGDVLAFSSQREDVLDDRLHPVVSPSDLVEIRPGVVGVAS